MYNRLARSLGPPCVCVCVWVKHWAPLRVLWFFDSRSPERKPRFRIWFHFDLFSVASFFFLLNLFSYLIFLIRIFFSSICFKVWLIFNSTYFQCDFCFVRLLLRSTFFIPLFWPNCVFSVHFLGSSFSQLNLWRIPILIKSNTFSSIWTYVFFFLLLWSHWAGLTHVEWIM